MGKTKLLDRFINDRFVPDASATIGAAFSAHEMQVTDKSGNISNVTLALWDTGGSERFEAMARSYYKGAAAAIVCFDVTDLSSWNRAKAWVAEVQESEGPNCTIALVATKMDLIERNERTRAVAQAAAQRYAASVDVRYFETSAKLGDKIQIGNKISEPFTYVATEAWARISQQQRQQAANLAPIVRLDQPQPQTRYPSTTPAANGSGRGPCCN